MVSLEAEAIGIACLNVRYSVRLSREAIVRERNLQKLRLAAEEETQAVMNLSLEVQKCEYSSV